MENLIDMREKMCPFLVMYILQEVAILKVGEQRVFLVDDPLAIKSVPEELEEMDDLECEVVKLDKGGWNIVVSRR